MSNAPRAWRLLLSHDDPAAALRWSREHNRIALGWGRIGHVVARGLDSERAIADAINHAYPGLGSASRGGKALYQFVYELQVGDLVVLRSKRNEAVVRVVGEYRLAAAGEPLLGSGYDHQRAVAFVRDDPTDFWRKYGGLGPGSPYCPFLPMAR